MYPRDSVEFWHSGKGLWPNTPDDKWNDYIWQLKNRITTLDQLKELMPLTESEIAGCENAGSKLALAITPHFFNLIDPKNADCPIRKQVIPRADESVVAPDEVLDPLGEDDSAVAPGLVHRYPDRVLLLTTDRCAAYCRYCTRSRLVSNAQDYNFHPKLDLAFEYLERHTEVRDVLLSGGDPLLLSDGKLEKILSRLRSIKHIEFIRIGSRIPVFLPQRITPNLCNILKKYGPIWMSIHTNHPKECTLELKEACDRLAESGVPLGNQSVLLSGINDSADIMKSLIHRLLMMRVKPYYIYQCDLITGSHHFRTKIEKGIEIIKGLRGHTTGYAIPQFVIDAPGGGGKIPINPDYVESVTNDTIKLRNFAGETYEYPAIPNVPMDSGILT